MGSGLSMQSRAEVTARYAKAYVKAGKKDKGRVLDEVVSVTGWSRDNARRRLTGAAKAPPGRGRQVPEPARKPRAPKYSYDARKVLQKVWAASGGQCGKYLAVSMATQLDGLERHGELTFGVDRYSPDVRAEDLRRRRSQGTAGPPLGQGSDPPAAGHRQLLAAGAAQPDRLHRPGLLPVPRPATRPLRELVRVAGPAGRSKRASRPPKASRARPYQVRRYNLVPAHHPGRARPRLPHRHHRPRQPPRRRKRGAPARVDDLIALTLPRGPRTAGPPHLEPATPPNIGAELVTLATPPPTAPDAVATQPEEPPVAPGCSTKVAGAAAHDYVYR